MWSRYNRLVMMIFLSDELFCTIMGHAGKWIGMYKKNCLVLSFIMVQWNIKKKFFLTLSETCDQDHVTAVNRQKARMWIAERLLVLARFCFLTSFSFHLKPLPASFNWPISVVSAQISSSTDLMGRTKFEEIISPRFVEAVIKLSVQLGWWVYGLNCI